MNFKYFATIMCLLLSQMAIAAKWATVVSEKAVIYSDIQMRSKIGFISKGKKIRVGDVRKNKGQLLPIIVNGKVAYIKVLDIQSNLKLKALQSVTERIKAKKEMKKYESRLSIFGGAHLSTLSSDNGDDTDNNFTFYGGGARGYYKSLVDDLNLRTAISYYKGAKNSEGYTITHEYASFEIDFLKSFIDSKSFDFSLFAGVNVIPFHQYTVSSLFKITGYGGGAQAGVDTRFSLSEKWSLHLSGAYQYIYLTGFELPENDIFEVDESLVLSGLRGAVMLSYEI